MITRLFLTLFITIIFVIPANAQDDEIIVTGSRLQNYQNDVIPVIHIKRRANFLVQNVSVISDSRDSKLRRKEVINTLNAMADRAARSSKIELAILRTFETEDDEIEFVEPFDKSKHTEEILTNWSLRDTTLAPVVLKTPVVDGDDMDSASSRITDFIESIPLDGRALINSSDDFGLTVVNIKQYRTPLLTALAADNAFVQNIFGEDYRVTISGLEQPLRWQVSVPLELTIYFPYTSTIAPHNR